MSRMRVVYGPAELSRAFADACAWADGITLCVSAVEDGQPGYDALAEHREKVTCAVLGASIGGARHDLVAAWAARGVWRVRDGNGLDPKVELAWFERRGEVCAFVLSGPLTCETFQVRSGTNVVVRGEVNDEAICAVRGLVERSRQLGRLPYPGELRGEAASPKGQVVTASELPLPAAMVAPTTPNATTASFVLPQLPPSAVTNTAPSAKADSVTNAEFAKALEVVNAKLAKHWERMSFIHKELVGVGEKVTFSEDGRLALDLDNAGEEDLRRWCWQFGLDHTKSEKAMRKTLTDMRNAEGFEGFLIQREHWTYPKDAPTAPAQALKKKAPPLPGRPQKVWVSCKSVTAPKAPPPRRTWVSCGSAPTTKAPPPRRLGELRSATPLKTPSRPARTWVSCGSAPTTKAPPPLPPQPYRRRAEDEAPRLQAVVPRLRSLRLRLEEGQQAETTPLVKHTRHIVVQRAPALFRIPCGDKECADGGYDLTRAVMRGLVATHESFTGDAECRGDRCRRKLRFIAEAEFTPA